MTIKNCSDCGKIYVENVSGLCPECLDKEEEQERLIIDFLRKKEKASVEEIHRETGVKERTILRMMKKGRFLYYGDIAYKCESCDNLITEGRVCDECGRNILKQVDEVNEKRRKEEEKKRSGERMYTRD